MKKKNEKKKKEEEMKRRLRRINPPKMKKGGREEKEDEERRGGKENKAKCAHCHVKESIIETLFMHSLIPKDSYLASIMTPWPYPLGIALSQLHPFLRTWDRFSNSCTLKSTNDILSSFNDNEEEGSFMQLYIWLGRSTNQTKKKKKEEAEED